MIIGAIQHIKKRWLRITAMVMGVMVSVLTVVNASVFPADFRTYDRLQVAANKHLEHIKADIALGKMSGGMDQMLKDVHVRIHALSDLEDVYLNEKDQDDSSPLARALDGLLVGEAHAQALTTDPRRPSWFKGRAPDGQNIYLVGLAEDDLLERARAASAADATESASAALAPEMPQIKNLSPEALADFIASAVRVADEYYEYDPAAKKFHHYTLVTIKRSGLEMSLMLFGAKVGVAVTPKDVESIRQVSPAIDYYERQQETYRKLAEQARASASASGKRDEERAVQAMDSGWKAKRAGDYDEAVRQLHAAVVAKRDFFLGWYRLGLAYEAKGDLEKAEEAYQYATQLADQQNVREPSVFHRLGYLLLRQGRAADSVPLFEKALKIDPAHPRARQNLEVARGLAERGTGAGLARP